MFYWMSVPINNGYYSPRDNFQNVSVCHTFMSYYLVTRNILWNSNLQQLSFTTIRLMHAVNQCVICQLCVHYISHMSALHVTYVCVTCHICVRYMSHMSALHVTYECVTCHICVRYMSHMCALHVTYALPEQQSELIYHM